jgi:PAS domain S-box-containing protein
VNSDASLPLHAATPLTNRESRFDAAELFFSRTDPAGIMLSGNSVFQRVSGYSWDELIGKPHKLIRHPGTPRAVFYLLWQTIKAGRPVGAYVQNKSKSGDYYWVFAVITPVKDGYLSVRLKPTSELVPKIKALYAAHVEMEQATRCTPSESAARLIDAVAAMGFADYGELSATALSRGRGARATAMGRTPDVVTETLRTVTELTGIVLARADAAHRSYVSLKHAPMNISLEAARAGTAGVATRVVAGNYQMLANELNEILTGFVVAANELSESVIKSLFLAGTAALQHEMYKIFETEKIVDCANSRADDMSILGEQQVSYAGLAHASLQDVVRAKTTFARYCTAMSRLVSALEVTRVMCEVEWAKVGITSGHMSALLEHFGAFQTEVRNGLRELDTVNQKIGSHAETAMASITGEPLAA